MRCHAGGLRRGIVVRVDRMETTVSAPLIGTKWAGRLLALKPNWDSYGAPRISRDAISTIEHFATVPCSDGGIQLEIHRNGFDIEIEVGPDGAIQGALVAREKQC